MSWKDWSYAKKGATIGIIYAIYYLIIVITNLGSIPFFSLTIWPAIGIAMIISFPLALLGLIKPSIDSSNMINISVAISIILIFALIGWIYGKIKNKNRQPSQT